MEDYLKISKGKYINNNWLDLPQILIFATNQTFK
jgi:hypothetical protein